jgi:hypothetical protein
MSGLEHPLILKLNGVGQDHRFIYMFLEHIESGDLMKVLNEFKQVPRDYV